ncbi:histidine phosphatase family protein [Brevundimonas sp. PAMC22021]|uniref:histidine phosphatase family protein n=1 Tax=Brevundimonas sp. PAMC22021 TaxID=2861285 RepID=UPI00351D390C
MTTIYLVRHGVHDQLGGRLCGRTPGVLMGEAGLGQAEAVGRRLANKDVEAVYASPMERTRQTAEPIARACGAPRIEEPALNEIDFGDWNGATFADLDHQPGWRRWNAERDQARAPRGETMLEVQLRLSCWLEDVARSGASAVVAVSHADVIKSVVALSLGLSMRSHDRFEVSPGSITTLSADAWGLKLQGLNETP